MDWINTGSAIIVSGISGLIGVILQKKWSASRPIINITALGFEGDIVEIPEELIKLREKCTWSDALSSFTSFKDLLKKEREATQTLAALQKTKEIVDNWLEKITIDGEAQQFSKNKLLYSPIISDGRIINATIMGSLKRKDFPELPIKINEIEKLNNVLPIEDIKGEKGWTIHCGRFSINYKDHNLPLQELENLKNIAYSIAKGSVNNIIFLHKYYSNFAGAEIYNQEKLVKYLRNLIIGNAKISMTVNISNLGLAPVIFKPYMAAKIQFGQTEKIFIMKTDSTPKEYSLKFDDIVRTEEFLHCNDPSPHISIKGGASLDITVTSIEKIGGESEVLSDFYELGALQGRILAKTLSNQIISSKLIHFGKSISNDEHKSLLDSIKDK